VRERRGRDDDRTGFILCRECLEPLVLDPSKIQRLGGRSFIECQACKNLIWIRRGDMHRLLKPGAADAPADGEVATATITAAPTAPAAGS
jgi:hypothetical protein